MYALKLILDMGLVISCSVINPNTQEVAKGNLILATYDITSNGTVRSHTVVTCYSGDTSYFPSINLEDLNEEQRYSVNKKKD